MYCKLMIISPPLPLYTSLSLKSEHLLKYWISHDHMSPSVIYYGKLAISVLILSQVALKKFAMSVLTGNNPCKLIPWAAKTWVVACKWGCIPFTKPLNKKLTKSTTRSSPWGILMSENYPCKNLEVKRREDICLTGTQEHITIQNCHQQMLMSAMNVTIVSRSKLVITQWYLIGKCLPVVALIIHLQEFC